jgi:splicing factor 3B subunit 2
MSIDASELEEGLSEDQLRRRYEEGSRSAAGGVHVPGGREDFSDFVAENTKKRQQKQDSKRKEREKEKDFKF